MKRVLTRAALLKGALPLSCVLAVAPGWVAVRAWSSVRHIDVADLAADGVEGESHVTVKFGLLTQDPADVQRAIAGFGPVRIALGRMSLFENDEHDVLKVDVESEDLLRLNALIGGSLPCQDLFREYRPHMTLAYLRRGSGRRNIRPTPLTGVRFTCSAVTFSDAQHNHTLLDLVGARTT